MYCWRGSSVLFQCLLRSCHRLNGNRADAPWAIQFGLVWGARRGKTRNWTLLSSNIWRTVENFQIKRLRKKRTFQICVERKQRSYFESNNRVISLEMTLVWTTKGARRSVARFLFISSSCRLLSATIKICYDSVSQYIYVMNASDNRNICAKTSVRLTGLEWAAA